MKIFESHVSPWKTDDRDCFMHTLEHVVFEGQDIYTYTISKSKGNGFGKLKERGKEGWREGWRKGRRQSCLAESFGVCFENESKEKFEVNLWSKGVKDYYQEVLSLGHCIKWEIYGFLFFLLKKIKPCYCSRFYLLPFSLKAMLST